MLTLGAWLVDRLLNPLVIFGLAGQFVFMLRFLVQWFVSERLGRSHVPIAFWYLSIGGGIMLLIYGVFDEDPVIILGQALGLLIYARNLVLIYRHEPRATPSAARHSRPTGRSRADGNPESPVRHSRASVDPGPAPLAGPPPSRG